MSKPLWIVEDNRDGEFEFWQAYPTEDQAVQQMNVLRSIYGERIDFRIVLYTPDSRLCRVCDGP